MRNHVVEPKAFRSADGRLRLSVRMLQTMRPVHLISGLHEQFGTDEQPSCGQPTTITGYTEWVDDRGSAVTLGWDWAVHCAIGQIRLHRISLPFTNLLLVGDDEEDLSWQHSLECLATYIGTLAWQGPTCEALRLRYAILPHQS